MPNHKIDRNAEDIRRELTDIMRSLKDPRITGFLTLVRVELPLAMPVIISGLRMAAIYTVSWAVLASMIGLGGLGDFVYRGTSSNNNTLILLGAIPAALLAIVFGAVIDLLQKKVTPRGLRKEAGK